MAAPSGVNRRLITEIAKLKALSSSTDSPTMKFLLDKSPIDDPSSGSRTGPANSTQNVILGRILPNGNAYNQAAFQIELKLPAEFPFKPPEVRFVTQIYHPNVDEQGKICVDLLNSSEAWKPTTPLVDVVKAVIDLIDNPKLDHALNAGRCSEPFHSMVNDRLSLSRDCQWIPFEPNRIRQESLGNHEETRPLTQLDHWENKSFYSLLERLSSERSAKWCSFPLAIA